MTATPPSATTAEAHAGGTAGVLGWSRYNRLFRAGGGRFLFSILSNTLVEVDDARYEALLRLQEGGAEGLEDEDFARLLRELHVLVEPCEEQDVLLLMRRERLAARCNPSVLALTVCPTLRCNFRCAYCWESSQQDGASMDAETADQLVRWIGERGGRPRLAVVWYGGEPLLAFDTICSLSERFRALDPAYADAALVTNGYLLDSSRIARLNALAITTVQVTLDGPREVHDGRRVLANGRGTFDRIVDNLAALMASGYRGRCQVRVNVDRGSAGSFLALRAALLERFDGRRLEVYAGQVTPGAAAGREADGLLGGAGWADFTLGVYREAGHRPRGGFHPRQEGTGECAATSQHGFVVGPQGEIYKCRNDVGKPAMVVGNIRERTLANPSLWARYTGSDPLADPKCRACDVLPLCWGACAHWHLRAAGGEAVEYCSVLEKRLLDYLEAYVDTVRTREICSSMLMPAGSERTAEGYRVVSPRAACPRRAATGGSTGTRPFIEAGIPAAAPEEG